MKEKILIKRLKIFELFGVYNVNIPFNEKVNIFVGENGLGKTTILNILNYIIQGDADGLASIDFKKIEIQLGNDEQIEITKDETMSRNKSKNVSRRSQYYDEEISLIERKIALEILKNYSDDEIEKRRHDILEDLYRKYRLEVSPRFLENIYDEFINNENERNKMKKCWEYKIYKYMKNWGNIIYLPTYRRIEEDFNNFLENSSDKEYVRYEKKKQRIKYMQFGMDDVQESIEKTCNNLRKNTNEGFKGMTSNILTNFIEIIEKNKKPIKLNKIDSAKLEIVFSRLTDEIDPHVKEKIISVVNGENIDNEEYNQYIMSVILELINIYEKNKEIDDNLENFKEVCNRYLVDKKIEYDKFKIECNVIQDKSKKIIDLKNLSSGEKQIISLFSKLYLNCAKNSIILFDEPELSLSILWQAHLIPDILETNKCGFICVVTHSPFIFDNQYDMNAVDIKQYISTVEKNYGV